MAASDLLFESPATGSADLVFGGSDPVGPALVEIAITGQFEPLSVSAGVAMVADVAITGSFEPLTVSASAEYRSNTQRPTVAATSARHQVAIGTQSGATHRQQDASASPAGWAAFWQRATGLTPGVEHRQAGTLKPLRVSTAAQHQDAAPMRDSKVFAHQVADRAVRRVLNTAFENASRVQDDTLFRHQDGDRTKRGARRTYWQQASGLGVRQRSSFQPASRLPVAWWSEWQEGVPPPPGVSSKAPGPPGPTPCYTPSPHLLFSFPTVIGGNLVFQCGDYSPEQPDATVVVPIQRVYIVLNSVTLVRVSDGAPITTKSLSLSLDASSWAWSFDATLPMQVQSLVEPNGSGNVELLASVNGNAFRLIVESISRERTFGTNSLRIAGRGRNAVLDAPYAPAIAFTNTIDRTANQLAEDVLTYNGVSLGWNVQWGLTDWLVPAGVFAHQGTHISALNAIAQSAGGYLQPDRTGTTLRILPKYPVAPWGWGAVTPDFQLPSAVSVRESMSWADKVAYNRVFVSGQQAGVLCQVTRAGSDGSLVAQMVTDPLITAAAAGRQRGIAVLGDTGRIATVGLSLPVLGSTGVIEPGKFVRYVDGADTHMGIVRSTQVTVGASAVDTRQAITLEVHA